MAPAFSVQKLESDLHARSGLGTSELTQRANADAIALGFVFSEGVRHDIVGKPIAKAGAYAIGDQPFAIGGEPDLSRDVLLMKCGEQVGRAGRGGNAGGQHRKTGHSRRAETGQRIEHAQHVIDWRSGSETLRERDWTGKIQAVGGTVDIGDIEQAFREPERSGSRINRATITKRAADPGIDDLGAWNCDTLNRSSAADCVYTSVEAAPCRGVGRERVGLGRKVSRKGRPAHNARCGA